VAVENVPDATVEAPTDAVAGITTTIICGSDLHMCRGRTSVQEGEVLGPVQHRLWHRPQLHPGMDVDLPAHQPTKGMDGAAYG